MLLNLARLLFGLLAFIGFGGVAHAGCAASSTSMSFVNSSSYDVVGGVVAQVSGSAGLVCSGSVLSLLGGSYARATVMSANGFKLSAGASDTIPYQVSVDSGGSRPFTQGQTIDYMSSSILSLLGIGSASNFVSPLFAKLTASPNISAGTYTDILTVNWDYSVCSGIQIGAICVGYESGTVTTTVTITLVVGKDCRITTSNVSFGTAALVAQFAPVNHAALVDCTKGAAYKIAFTSGQSGSARPWRAMTDGAGNSLQYNIYRADGVTIWDETNPLPSASIGSGSTTPAQIQSYVVKVNAAQVTPPAGAYSDLVSILISF